MNATIHITKTKDNGLNQFRASIKHTDKSDELIKSLCYSDSKEAQGCLNDLLIEVAESLGKEAQ